MAAFQYNVLPNLLDWARAIDPNGAVADIAELLSQCNEVLKDIIWKEGNLPLGHKISVRAGLPQGTWRGNNQGVASTKSLKAQFQFAIGELVDYSLVDKSEAVLNGEVDAFRLQEDMSHIEGMSQQIASAIFYSNEAVNPSQFTGLAPQYNTISTASAKNAVNVLSAGGSASANTSMWLAGWGDETLFGIFPKGSPAGLQFEDKGDVRALYDVNGNQFEGYTSYFCWKLGIAVKDWRYTARLCNIDTTTNAGGLFSTTPPDLYAYMSRLVIKFPTMTMRASGITESDSPREPAPGINPAFYCNRTVRENLDIQAIRDKNVLLSFKDFAGAPVMGFREVPIRIVDALTNAESTIS
jgi:hypothetical protein